jgi:aminoglycoside phosphotransferase (APT) family kinase protein
MTCPGSAPGSSDATSRYAWRHKEHPLSVRRLHADQPSVDVALVYRLIASQHPQWAGLPIERVASDGTTNAIYRLGPAVAVRLPLVRYGERAIDVEGRWLPQLGRRLPLAVPEQLATGEPEGDFPFRWSMHRWIEGEAVSRATVEDRAQLAYDLAAWLAALQRIDTTGGPDASLHDLRGAPLARRDAETRRGLAALADELDVDAALAVWQDALRAERWSRAPVWSHGDLLAGNLLARSGRLAAVIDFAGLGVGDPACDLMIAWCLFSGASRTTFREALRDAMDLDEATWVRGRGHALYQAAIYIPYYRHANPTGVAAARHQLAAVLGDGT